MTAPNEELWDVAIIGYGPTGATLANLLGQAGLHVLVLEREAAAYHLPRAVHFDAEVMRVFQTIGLAAEIEPITMYHPGMRFVDAEGKLLLDWPRPLEPGPQGWKAGYRFHQPELEDILRRGLARYGNVTVRSRCELFLAQQQDDHVELRFEDMSCGVIERIRARYVVGCDGARSTIRRFIESRMEDCGFHERWLVIDLILKQPRPELGDHSIQYCNPARPATYVPISPVRRRWEITVLPHEDSREIATADNVWSLLGDWIGPHEATLERATVYTFHSLIAQQWRAGRLFLAGDSCHQTPPFMGQGMCAGIRDAANLAWKLIYAVQQGHDDAMLDSYESERRPNVSEYITTAVRLGGLINACGTENALRAAFRGQNGAATMTSLISRLGPGLGSGEHAGTLFPQSRLADGRLLDDAVGYHVAVVADGGKTDRIELPPGVALVATDDAPGVAKDLQALGAIAVLLRPDRYVLASASTPEELRDLVALAGTVAGCGPKSKVPTHQEKISA